MYRKKVQKKCTIKVQTSSSIFVGRGGTWLVGRAAPISLSFKRLVR